MNSRQLIDQTTGRADAAQVMRAAHRRARFIVDRSGAIYRKVLAAELRNFWSLAHNESAMWALEHSTGSAPMARTGGRDADGVANERVA